MDWFSKKPTVKEQQRDNDRALRKANREVERDRRELEREEKKLELEIKRNAQAGNKDACRILAKQLVNIRKQKNRTYVMNSKIQGVSSQNRVLGANVKMAEAVSVTAKTMTNMNKIMKPEQVSADMRNFQHAMTKMDMTDEMINDTLDEMLDESGDEEESDNIISRVLDEIGIEISGKISAAPSAVRGTIGESSKSSTVLTDEDLEKQLAKLRSQ